MKIALTVQYNGTRYAGFQIQKDRPSVQGELENAIRVFFRVQTRVHGAGRTDAGVHAVGQVVHFSLPDDNPEGRGNLAGKSLQDGAFFQKAIYSLNCILPGDISIIYGKIVDEKFHARFSCIGREYAYRVLNSEYRMALTGADCLWIREELSIPKILEAANVLLGEHDFAAFTKSIYQKTGEITIRRIDDIRVVKKGPQVYFYYNGSGFLHNMIRIMTGVLLKAGTGQLSTENVREILEGKNREHTGVTLPAYPLVFMNAKYHGYETPRHLIPFYSLMGIEA